MENEGREVHFHAGGQGFWIAHLIAELGVHVTLVAPLGGEAGVMLPGVVGAAGVGLRATAMGDGNAVLVQSRHGDTLPAVVAAVPARSLTRHELDDLYDATLVEGLEAGVAVLAGPGAPPLVPPSIYCRLATDLQTNGVRVVADVSGEHLRDTLGGGVSVLKVSADQLRDDGLLRGDAVDDVVSCAEGLRRDGADSVIVTLAGQGALLATADGAWLVDAPAVEVVESRGAGDSLTAGVAATLAAGGTVEDGARLGAAAGVLNVTRRGLGSGARREIRDLAGRIGMRRAAERRSHAGARDQR